MNLIFMRIQRWCRPERHDAARKRRLCNPYLDDDCKVEYCRPLEKIEKKSS